MKRALPLMLVLAALLFVVLPAQAQAAHTVTLSWVAPTTGTTPTGYNVKRGTVTGGPYTQLNTTKIVGLAYTDSSTTLTEGSSYFYVVTSVYDLVTPALESGPSNQAVAVIPITIPPTNPTNLQAVPH